MHQFKFKICSVGDIVTDINEAVKGRFPGDLKLFIATEDAKSKVFADPEAIVTALLNFIENAYKYSDKQKKVTLKIYNQKGICFEVIDRGIGMSRKAVKEIFTRFYQVDQKLSRSDSGCGLGLSIVQYIMKAHKTEVQVKSELGRGSSFSFRLPLVQEN